MAALHRLSSSSRCARNSRTSLGASKCPATPLARRPTENARPSRSGMIANTDLIGDVVADEKRTAAPERLMRHQFAHAGRLGETGMLDLADAFARQHLDRRVRQIGPDQRHRLIDRLLRMRREAIMQRERIALVLQQDSRAQPRDGREPSLQFLVHRRRVARDRLAVRRRCRISAPWPPTAGNCIRRENQIDVIERAAADQRQRAIGSRRAGD